MVLLIVMAVAMAGTAVVVGSLLAIASEQARLEDRAARELLMARPRARRTRRAKAA